MGRSTMTEQCKRMKAGSVTTRSDRIIPPLRCVPGFHETRNHLATGLTAARGETTPHPSSRNYVDGQYIGNSITIAP